MATPAASSMKPARGARRGRRRIRILCATLVASSPATPAIAQYDADELRGIFRIEVTGSRIARSDVEAALPVQVLTREDIDRAGVSTVAELMSKVSANVGAFGDALSVGLQQFNPRVVVPRPGLSSVNLRGIGDGSTLVLINGRRVANYAFDGGAVDVNAIPLAAIDRVEILKDGASAIYGTDAIAGVVNFILRKDYRGGEATGYGNFTQHGGGNQYQASASAGFGDLTTDRFNAFVTLDYQKDEALHPSDRSFAGYRPDDPLFLFSRWTFPANIIARPGVWINPSFAGGCAPPDSLPVPFEGQRWCGYDVDRFFDILPRVTRASILGRVTLQILPNLQLFADASYAHNEFSGTIVPTSAGGGFFPGNLFYYPAGAPYYPAEFAAANGLSGDLSLLLRTTALGPRVNDVTTDALRTLVGVEGTGFGWIYGAAVTYSENRQRDDLASGYVSSSRLSDALATGLVNPFGPSGPEGDALLAGASIGGDFHRAKGSTWLIDFNASRELIRLPGGSLGIALGAEARRERLTNSYSEPASSGDVLGVGGERSSMASNRNVEAIFAEASIPFAAGVESQIALRYDHYSDFGHTVNPKAALSWQPVKALLLRASWGTGFRAPTLYDLHTPLQQTFTELIEDPIRCPVTQAPGDCNGEFPAVVGGNPNLKPETSTQFNAGVVWAPTAGFSLSLDYWKIDKKNIIVALSERDVLLPDAPFAGNAIRGPADADFPDLPGPIQTVVLWNENFGDLKTSGYDVGLNWRAPETSFGRLTFALDGTYVSTYEVPDGSGGTFPFVGNNDGPYPVPRWRHYASVYWNCGAWSATLAQTFQSGYDEADLRSCGDDGCLRRRVGSYSAWNLQAEYTGFRNTRLAVGVKNLFDRNPPQAQWNPTGGGVGFDPSYADPRGRSFYARIAYVFD